MSSPSLTLGRAVLAVGPGGLPLALRLSEGLGVTSPAALARSKVYKNAEPEPVAK